ncbi:MAG: glycosyltransferase family 1 protein [Planctomycetes bacterium]|nr:glycosyltransferase family 1 protein [Planctomycetota bacterium]
MPNNNKMHKIVFATFGSYGDVLPYLAVGQELKKLGYNVKIATSEYYRTAVEQEGLEFSPIRPNINYDNREIFRRVMDATYGTEFVVREIIIPNLKESYHDLEHAMAGADLLTSHVLTYYAPIFAEKNKIKWISTALSPMVFCSAYDPPIFAPIPWLSGLRCLGPQFNGWMLRQLKKISTSWGDPIRSFRSELGLQPGNDPLWEGQHSPHKVLALFSSVFAKAQPDWPEQTKICGFPIKNSKVNENDQKINEFIAAGTPPIVFTLGSSAVMVADQFYESAINAVSKLDQRAILVAGQDTDRLQAMGNTSNILAVPWANFDHIFKGASAIVHPGGIGTAAQALKSGKPQIVIPFAHDQFDNAYRVRKLNLGITVKRGRKIENKLAAALKQILTSPSYTKNAEQIAISLEGEDGVKTACNEIECML